MIIDTLANASPYAGLGAGFDLAFAYLRSDRPATDEVGRYDLDGDRVFAMVQEYETKPIEEGLWEAHEKYADVQYIVNGQERMGLAMLDQMTVDKPYNADDDYALYRGDGVFFPFRPQMFGVFMPQDVHMPSMTDRSPAQMRKVVIKIQVRG